MVATIHIANRRRFQFGPEVAGPIKVTLVFLRLGQRSLWLTASFVADLFLTATGRILHSTRSCFDLCQPQRAGGYHRFGAAEVPRDRRVARTANRDRMAIEAAQFLKRKNVHSEVTEREVETGKVTQVQHPLTIR